MINFYLNNSLFVLYVANNRFVTDVTATDGLWHHICVTWTSQNGDWAVYMDGAQKAYGTDLSPGVVIPGGGILVVGQDQDILGGGFNDPEAFMGEIAQLYVWPVELQPSDVMVLASTCAPYGMVEIFAWPDILGGLAGGLEPLPLVHFCRGQNPV
ncbi:SVEP1 [Cordylochernes scorpioides]|uniref:Pentraxin family member n=1 Tax=Cordylochernes scorpioides TaxID=51811 RepID=A0ABY6L7N6_9ARAC|nr:SVEP1 [Cordylochernes scorpioides]